MKHAHACFGNVYFCLFALLDREANAIYILLRDAHINEGVHHIPNQPIFIIEASFNFVPPLCSYAIVA